MRFRFPWGPGWPYVLLALLPLCALAAGAPPGTCGLISVRLSEVPLSDPTCELARRRSPSTAASSPSATDARRAGEGELVGTLYFPPGACGFPGCTDLGPCTIDLRLCVPAKHRAVEARLTHPTGVVRAVLSLARGREGGVGGRDRGDGAGDGDRDGDVAAGGRDDSSDGGNGGDGGDTSVDAPTRGIQTYFPMAPGPIVLEVRAGNSTFTAPFHSANISLPAREDSWNMGGAVGRGVGGALCDDPGLRDTMIPAHIVLLVPLYLPSSDGMHGGRHGGMYGGTGGRAHGGAPASLNDPQLSTLITNLCQSIRSSCGGGGGENFAVTVLLLRIVDGRGGEDSEAGEAGEPGSHRGIPSDVYQGALDAADAVEIVTRRTLNRADGDDGDDDNDYDYDENEELEARDADDDALVARLEQYAAVHTISRKEPPPTPCEPGGSADADADSKEASPPGEWTASMSGESSRAAMQRIVRAATRRSFHVGHVMMHDSTHTHDEVPPGGAGPRGTSSAGACSAAAGGEGGGMVRRRPLRVPTLGEGGGADVTIFYNRHSAEAADAVRPPKRPPNAGVFWQRRRRRGRGTTGRRRSWSTSMLYYMKQRESVDWSVLGELSRCLWLHQRRRRPVPFAETERALARARVTFEYADDGSSSRASGIWGGSAGSVGMGGHGRVYAGSGGEDAG